jgi:hypothetical protein
MHHLEFITQSMKSIGLPVMVLGDFHLPPWAYEVQRFKEMMDLRDGRRDIQGRNLDGSVSLPRIPVEHILFSEPWECTSFSELGNAVVGRLGITGTYQMQFEATTQ